MNSESEVSRSQLWLKHIFHLEICHNCLLTIEVGDSKMADVDYSEGCAKLTKEMLADISATLKARMAPPKKVMFKHYHRGCWNKPAEITRNW